MAKRTRPFVPLAHINKMTRIYNDMLTAMPCVEKYVTFEVMCLMVADSTEIKINEVRSFLENYSRRPHRTKKVPKIILASSGALSMDVRRKILDMLATAGEVIPSISEFVTHEIMCRIVAESTGTDAQLVERVLREQYCP